MMRISPSLKLRSLRVHTSYYGGPEFACPHCQTVYWSADRCKRQTVRKDQPPAYNRCCHAGKISLPGFHDWPDPLKKLLRFDDSLFPWDFDFDPSGMIKCCADCMQYSKSSSLMKGYFLLSVSYLN